MNNPTIFVVLAITARICEGIAFGTIQSTTYGVSSQELSPYEFDRYARSNSIAGGIGGSLALLLGSFLFSIGGYMLPYFVLGSMFLLLAFVIFMTNALESKAEKDLPCERIDNNFYELLIESESTSSSPPERSISHGLALSFPVSILFLTFRMSNMGVCQLLSPTFDLLSWIPSWH